MMMNQLEAISSLLYAPGVPMTGYEISDEDAIKSIRERFSDRPYCLVRNWIWIDIDISDSVRDEVLRAGRQPVMLYAHEVVFDSLGRFRRGDWVRSSPLVSFFDDCFFQTHNTLYVLLGTGERKRAEPSVISSIIP